MLPTFEARVEQIRSALDRRDWREIARLSADLAVLDATDGVSFPFVGRTNELARLDRARRRAATAAQAIALVTGEPGIGKTRLIDEIGHRARAAGSSVVTGRALETSTAPACWPWIEIMQALGRGHDAAADQRPDRRGTSMALAAPNNGISGPTGSASGTMPDSVVVGLAETIENLIVTAAASAPVLAVLEDLHWADDPSLDLLELVSRSVATARCLLVVSIRDHEIHRRPRLEHAIDMLARQPGFIRIDLPALASMRSPGWWWHEPPARPSTRRDPSTQPVTAILCSPIELAGLLESGGRVEDRIPETIRSVIRHRFEHHGESARSFLTAAAMLGDTFDLDRLYTVTDDPTLGLGDQIIAGCLHDRTIVAIDGDPGRFRFVHDLFRQFLIDAVPAHRRVALHGTIANALERDYGNQADAHATEIAHHLMRASGPDPSMWSGTQRSPATSPPPAATSRRRWNCSLEAWPQPRRRIPGFRLPPSANYDTGWCERA